jgi:hypothetical protein
VRIEARDEPSKHERKARVKTTATATARTPLRKNKCKSNDKNLDNASRLIEAALSGSQRKAPGSAGGYLHGLGGSRDSEISTFSQEEVSERAQELRDYFELRKREHDGERLEFELVTLP